MCWSLVATCPHKVESSSRSSTRLLGDQEQSYFWESFYSSAYRSACTFACTEPTSTVTGALHTPRLYSLYSVKVDVYPCCCIRDFSLQHDCFAELDWSIDPFCSPACNRPFSAYVTSCSLIDQQCWIARIFSQNVLYEVLRWYLKFDYNSLLCSRVTQHWVPSISHREWQLLPPPPP